MKKIILTLVILMMGLGSFSSFSQNRNDVIALGLPGDNFNLYAVLDVFQKSKTLEEFEQVINSRDSNINNLDLNNDGFVDYITVHSYNQGNFYSIVLRDSFGANDFQDVAVIQVSKNNSGQVLIQIVGDEALYGENYIVEPSSGYGTPNPGYTGGETLIVRNYSPSRVVFVNDWPIVISLFSPSFSLYISPWYWGYYPVYWSPWAPIRYYSYWNFHYHYYRSPHFHRISFVRFPRHHSYYLKRRYVSPIVVRNRRSGVYRRTYDGISYRRPEAPRRLSRSEVRREVRRSRTLDTRNYNRQQATESGRRQVQPTQRQQNRESDRRQVIPNQRQENRQVTPNQKQQNRELRRQPQRGSERSQITPNQRTERRSSTRVQRSVAPKQQPRSVQRQENGQTARPQMQRSTNRPSINQPSRVSRQAGSEIRRMNRSENRSIQSGRSSGQNKSFRQNRSSGNSRGSRR